MKLKYLFFSLLIFGISNASEYDEMSDFEFLSNVYATDCSDARSEGFAVEETKCKKARDEIRTLNITMGPLSHDDRNAFYVYLSSIQSRIAMTYSRQLPDGRQRRHIDYQIGCGHHKTALDNLDKVTPPLSPRIDQFDTARADLLRNVQVCRSMGIL